MNLASIIDAMIMPFAPERARKRLAARVRYEHLSTYAGAVMNRRTKDWRAVSSSADAAILPDWITLTARSRQLVRDNPYAKSITGAFRRNVIGKGITPKASTVDETGKPRVDANKQINHLWRLWAHNKWACDVEGVKTFPAMQRQAVAQIPEVGEFIFVWSYTARSERSGDLLAVPGLQLQAIEPERLWLGQIPGATGGIFAPAVNPDTGYEVRGGIEVDKRGRPVAYWISPTHPNDPYGQTQPPERIPADRVFHLFVQDRPRQTRGVTWFAPVLGKMRDLGEYDATQLDAARIEACIALIINRNTAPAGPPTITGVAGESSTDRDGNRLAEMQSGMIFEGTDGETVTGMYPQRPGSMYRPFVQQHLRAISAGVGLQYETVARDFTGGSFSSQRQGMLEDRREYETFQQDIIDNLMRGVWRLFVTFAVAEGLVDGVDMGVFSADTAGWTRAEFMADGWQWVDPQKEANAALTALQARLTTRSRILAGQGEDFEETIQQTADEEARMASLGLNPQIPFVAGGMQPEPPQPKPDAVDEVDEAVEV